MVKYIFVFVWLSIMFHYTGCNYMKEDYSSTLVIDCHGFYYFNVAYDHFTRAWKDQLIRKYKNKANILEMNDDLGDIIYVENYETMLGLWQSYKNKWATKKEFMNYFED